MLSPEILKRLSFPILQKTFRLLYLLSVQEEQNILWKLLKQSFEGVGERGELYGAFCLCPPDKQHLTFRVWDQGLAASPALALPMFRYPGLVKICEKTPE